MLLSGSPAAGGSEAAPGAPPDKGMTMAQVRTGYGDPLQALPAVGKPPITRWVYRDYVVYFEHDHVIHSVRPPQPAAGSAAGDTVASAARAPTEGPLP
jgi:hypothetical protein